MFIFSVVGSSWLSAQRQLSASCLFMAGDILYCRALGWGFWVQTTKGHPPNGGSDHVHICYTSHLIPYDVAHTHGGDSGGCHHSNGHGTMGASEAISKGSGIWRQAVTPAKPHGGVNGHMTANACTGEEGLDGVGVFDRGPGGFAGPAQGSWVDPPLGLKALHGGEISPAATTGQEGCRIFSHPKNFGLLLSVSDSGTQGVLEMSVGRVSRLWSSSFSGRATPWNTSSSEKERYYFTSSLNSFMLSASRHGPPPAGRLISSTQCWRALAYATAFSWGISLISLHA